MTFTFDSLDKAEPFDPRWDRYDAQKVCGQRGSTIQGGLGPFGILALASNNLKEYTAVFFRVFKATDKHLVLMCSDASRLVELKIDKLNMLFLSWGVINMHLFYIFHRSSLNQTHTYRPSFAGFVNVDLTRKKLSLRSLVCLFVLASISD